MRHRKRKKIFGRKRGPRKALIRSLVLRLLYEKKITLSKAKAKVVRSEVEKLITIAKRNDLASRRLIIKKLGSSADGQKAASLLLEQLQKKYADRHGGYTKMANISPRRGDASPMTRIEFV